MLFGNTDQGMLSELAALYSGTAHNPGARDKIGVGFARQFSLNMLFISASSAASPIRLKISLWRFDADMPPIAVDAQHSY